jgi:GTP-binding protein
VINRELDAYGFKPGEREQIVVATKIDALDDPQRLRSLKQQAQNDGRTFIEISSSANKNIRELISLVAKRLSKSDRKATSG